MRKTLSLFAAVLFAGSMMAGTIEFSGADFTGGTANTGSAFSVTKNGVTVSANKAYGTGSELRVYATGEDETASELTVSAGSVTITKITPEFAANSKLTFEEATPNATSWSIEATKQIRLSKLTVTIDGDGGTSEGGEEGGEGGEEGDLNYDYEPTEVTTINLALDYISYADYTASESAVVVTIGNAADLQSADSWAELLFVATSFDGAIPAGTYEITNTQAEGTFYASPGGDEEYDYPSYLGVPSSEEGYYDPYYLISGTVTIAANGALTVNATSYNGSTIKLTCAGEPAEEGTDPEQKDVYNVAEAIAAVDAEVIKDDDEITVRGEITKISIKGKNFEKYHSATFYVKDVTGAEGEFQFFNCVSISGATFASCNPAHDPQGSAWENPTSVTDANGIEVKVGDVVEAKGPFKKYNSTYELNQGCQLTKVGEAQGIEETLAEGKAVKLVRDGQVLILKGDNTFNMMGQHVK